MLERRHRDGIFGLDAADSARRPDDVGAFNVRAVRCQMADWYRHVDGFYDDAPLPVQDAERMRELEDVAERGDIAKATAALGITDVGGAVDRTEVHHPAADVQMPPGVACVQHEGLRRMGKLRLDEVAAEADLLCFVVDEGAGPAKHFTGRRTANLESSFLEDTERGNENPLDLLPRQDLER